MGAVPSPKVLVSCVVTAATPGLDSVRGSNRRSSDNVECPFTVRNTVIPMDWSICTSTCISKANLAMTELSTPSRVTLGVDLAISRKRYGILQYIPDPIETRGFKSRSDIGSRGISSVLIWLRAKNNSQRVLPKVVRSG
jgi:hypothetical protein